MVVRLLNVPGIRLSEASQWDSVEDAFFGSNRNMMIPP